MAPTDKDLRAKIFFGIDRRMLAKQTPSWNWQPGAVTTTNFLNFKRWWMRGWIKKGKTKAQATKRFEKIYGKSDYGGK